MAAGCLLAAAERVDEDTDEGNRALVGVALIAETMREVRTIKEILLQVFAAR